MGVTKNFLKNYNCYHRPFLTVGFSDFPNFPVSATFCCLSFSILWLLWFSDTVRISQMKHVLICLPPKNMRFMFNLPNGWSKNQHLTGCGGVSESSK